LIPKRKILNCDAANCCQQSSLDKFDLGCGATFINRPGASFCLHYLL